MSMAVLLSMSSRWSPWTLEPRAQGGLLARHRLRLVARGGDTSSMDAMGSVDRRDI